MVNYDLKSSVLNDHRDLIDLQREWSIYCFSYDKPCYALDLDYVSDLNDRVNRVLSDPFLSPLFEEAEKINNAFYMRKKRIKDRLISMYIRAPCYFVTLTFTDLVLSSTSFDTRRKYVTRFLKSVSSDYIANVDYGDINHREHYHAIIIPIVDSFCSSWSYGFTNSKLIRNSDTDFKRVSTYISKLTNHAIKETNSLKKIIYSRG